MSFRNFISRFKYIVVTACYLAQHTQEREKVDNKKVIELIDKFWWGRFIYNICLYYYYIKLLTFYWMVFDPAGRIYYLVYIKPIMTGLGKIFKNLLKSEWGNIIFLIVWYSGWLLGVIGLYMLLKDFICLFCYNL